VTELERDLKRLGRDVEYPATPSLAAAVGRRLEGSRQPPAPDGRRDRRWRQPTLRAGLLAAALLLLLAASVTAAVPAAREAVLEFLGLRGATVERVPALPAGLHARPGLDLGRSVGLPGTRRRLGFRPLLPSDLGAPAAVFVNADPPGGELTLAYAPRPDLPRSRLTGVGLLVSEIRGGFGPGFYGKFAPPETEIERLRIDGHGAIWVQGLHGFQKRLHGFLYKDARHTFRTARARLAANTLLLQRGPVMVRVEGRIDLAKAEAIARSLR
jgi:hypothetical protein